MKPKNYILLILFVLFVNSGAFAQTDVEKSYERCRNDYQELIRADKKRMRHNWVKVIKCFENISGKGAQEKRAIDSLFTLGVIYKHLYTYSSIDSDINNALSYFKRVVDEFPKSSLVDDALLNRGKIFLEDKRDYTKSYLELTELLDKYPDSDSAKKGAILVSEIKKKKPKDDEVVSVIKNKNEAEITSELPKEPTGKMIQDIKHWTNPDYTRVAIYLNSKADYNYNVLDVDETNLRPRRIYVDISNSTLLNNLSGNIPIKDGLLTQARIGKFKKNVTRVVLDAEKDFDYNIFAWEEPFRIIIDIKSKDAQIRENLQIVDLSSEEAKSKPPEVEIQEEKPGIGGKTPLVAQPKTDDLYKEKALEIKTERSDKTAQIHSPVNTLPKRSQEYVKTVVIDPGHGGKDNGAVGRNGTMEKDIVLEISKRLKKILSKDDNIEVIMTREDDTYVPLESRTGMAVQAQADLFVSIHANAHTNKNVKGISTYFLDDTDDKDSIMTALKENYSSRDYVGAVDSRETKDLLSYTFASLQKNYDTIRSIPLAELVHKDLLKSLRRGFSSVNDLGVRKGIFWVLCGTNTPAVLVEASFVSNSLEEKRLKSEKYQDSIAKGIAEGIRQYLKNPVAMSGHGYLSAKKVSN